MISSQDFKVSVMIKFARHSRKKIQHHITVVQWWQIRGEVAVAEWSQHQVGNLRVGVQIYRHLQETFDPGLP